MKLGIIKDRLLNRKYLIITYLLICLFMIAGITSVGKLQYPRIETILILVVVIFGIGIILFYSNKDNLHNFAFVIVIFFGLINVFVTPICDVPDEVTHFRRAEITSRGSLFPQIGEMESYKTIKSVDNIRSNDTEFTILQAIKNGYSIDYQEISVTNIAGNNFFIGYIPQAIGINIAKLFNMPQIWMLILGRIMNLLMVAIVVRKAIKIVDSYKMPVFIISCLPMTVYLSSSMSIDATINAFSVLVISYFIKLYESSERITLKEVIIYFLLCLVVGLSKITYMAFAALLFFLPIRKYKNNKVYGLTIGGIILMAMIALGWYYIVSSNALPAADQTSYLIENNVNLEQQIKNIIQNPIQTIQIIIKELAINGQFVFNGLFTFGPLTYGNAFLSTLFILLYGGLLFLYPLGIEYPIKMKAGAGIVSGLVFCATELIMYLTWTGVGALGIAGVQARYLIPLLALMPILCNVNNSSYDFESISKIDLFFILGVLVLLIGVIVLTLNQYYLH